MSSLIDLIRLVTVERVIATSLRVVKNSLNRSTPFGQRNRPHSRPYALNCIRRDLEHLLFAIEPFTAQATELTTAQPSVAERVHGTDDSMAVIKKRFLDLIHSTIATRRSSAAIRRC